MKKDLIKDAGKIRNCPSNIVKMGYWRTLWEFHGYWKTLKHMTPYVWECVSEVIKITIAMVLLPVLPFVQCYLKRKRALRLEQEYKCEVNANKEINGNSNKVQK